MFLCRSGSVDEAYLPLLSSVDREVGVATNTPQQSPPTIPNPHTTIPKTHIHHTQNLKSHISAHMPHNTHPGVSFPNSTHANSTKRPDHNPPLIRSFFLAKPQMIWKIRRLRREERRCRIDMIEMEVVSRNRGVSHAFQFLIQLTES